jgi:integrase/recombinase XerD
LEEYFDLAGHRSDLDGWLFRPATKLAKHSRAQLSADSIYQDVVMHYCERLGISMELLGPHALRATCATNALQHGSDIAEGQEWLGHSSISTTGLYDQRKMRAEDSPTFKVKYSLR